MPLAPQVQQAAADALLELLPTWLAQPASDYRRVFRPTGPGNYSIAIEPYRGSMTWIGFLRHLESSTAIPRLKAAIATFQPELASHLVVPGGTMHLGDTNALVTTWCTALESELGPSGDIASAVHALLVRFSSLLDARTLTHRITTAIAGLRLPSHEFQINLDDRVIMRAMTADELVELSSHDITFGRDEDIMSHSVSSCLVFERASPFSLERTPPQNLLASDAEQEARDCTTDVLRALHILKSGRAGIFKTSSELMPRLLPNLGRGSSWPLYRPPFASLELVDQDIALFVELLRALRANVRDEIRIAADRLVDAESRLSPVDSLLDAAIGLEVLLNPMDSTELAFRVALNYAYLSAPETRRERYDRVRAVQKTRNRVVHGGLNLASPEAQLVHQHAELAKATLRDSIHSFLRDSTLGGNRKLDAEFWLDRILPANLVSATARLDRPK